MSLLPAYTIACSVLIAASVASAPLYAAGTPQESPAATNAAPPATGTMAVEIFVPSRQDLFLTMFTDTLTQQARRHQLKVREFDAGNRAETQLEQFRQNQRRHAAAVVRAVSTELTGELIDQARLAGTLIIMFNLPPERSALESYEHAWYVGGDTSGSGRLQGEMVLDYLRSHKNWDKNRNGTLDILLLRGNPEHPDSETRTNEVLATLDEAGIRYTLQDDFNAQWFFETAFRHVTELINDGRFGEFDMVIANNDDMALGCIDAIEQSGAFAQHRISYLPVFGVDGMPDALAAMRRGALTGTVMQDYRRMAETAFHICEGQTAPEQLEKVLGFAPEGRFIQVPYLKMDRTAATRLMVNQALQR